MARTPKLLQSLDGRYTELVITYLSDSVAASLYYHTKGEVPRVLASVEEHFPTFTHHPHRQEIIDESLLLTRRVCERVLLEARELYEIKDLLKDDQGIDYVSCFLSVPWLQYQYYNRETNYDVAQRIDTNWLNTQLSNDIPSSCMRIDRHIAPVFANGYATGLDVALSNKLRSINFGVTESFARFEDIETLYQVLTGELNIESSQLYLYSVGNTLRLFTQAKHSLERDYVSVHIHGYSSDVMVVQNGEISYAGAINFGYYDCITRLRQGGVALDSNTIWSMLAMRSRGELRTEVESILKRVGSSICVEYEQAIKTLMADRVGLSEPMWTYLPRDWYVLSDRAFGKYFAQFVRDHDEKRRVLTPLAQESTGKAGSGDIQTLHRVLITHRQSQAGLVFVH